MADIILTNDGSSVVLNFAFRTPQAFYYTIEVVDDQLKQYFHATGQWNGAKSFTLGKSSDLIGLYLDITWTVIDPAGSGNPFYADATAYQNGNAKSNPQVCSGTTSTSPSNLGTSGKFTSKP